MTRGGVTPSTRWQFWNAGGSQTISDATLGAADSVAVCIGVANAAHGNRATATAACGNNRVNAFSKGPRLPWKLLLERIDAAFARRLLLQRP
jgi:hypothetical protein